MTEMIFDTCQRLGGYVWCSVVRDLIVERWQTIYLINLIARYFVYVIQTHFICCNKVENL
jgi:hypothetical protein